MSQLKRKRSIERAFWRVTQSTASLTGRSFYKPLAESLAKALDVDHVILTERMGQDSNILRSLAFVSFQKEAPNFEYDCRSTPCAKVVSGREFVVNRGLRKRFPLDKDLELLEAESYAGVPLKSIDNEILGHLAILTCKELPDAKDILAVLRVFAARAAAELERQETELRFKAIAASMDDAFWLFTADFKKVVYVSPGFEKIWRQPIKALYRSPKLWFDSVHPADRKRVRAAFQKGSTADPVEIEYRIRRSDGAVRLVRVRAFPVSDLNDGTPKCCGFAEDVTERRAESKELERSRKFGAIGQMAGSVTHDFKTVLTVIRGAIGVLEDEPAPSPSMRRILDMLTTACDRGMALTSQLLSFARNEEGPLAPLEINPVAEQTAELLGRLMPPAVKIELKLENNAPRVLADRCQIEQLLTNLVLNARDAMTVGGTITIRTHRSAFPEHPPRPALLLAVTDTGVGMDSATLEQIMDPFFSTKERDKGSGIGMTTVQNIVARHDGRLGVESTPGTGTQVSVLLPLAEPASGKPSAVRRRD
jgi:PAS domain S-box-containing protein